MVVKTNTLDGTISDDVLKFAKEKRILEYVEKAITAAREVFINARAITVSLKRDPQYGDLYVDVHVVLPDHEDPETAAQKDDDCISKWVPLVPPDLGGLIHHSSSWMS